MTANEFIFWQKGFFEISESNTLTEKQVQVIKDHLDLCFSKVTPDRSKEKRNHTNTEIKYPESLFC